MHVASLHVYPVKSCGGFSPQQWKIVQTGFQHDREWMLTDEKGLFLSQRDDPILATIHVTISDGYLHFHVGLEKVFSWPMNAITGDRRCVQVHTDRLLAFDQGDVPARNLSEIVGRPVRLVKKSPLFDRFSPGQVARGVQVGLADAYPFLLATTTSLDDLNQRLEQPVLMNRFRPNVVVEDVADPYAEDLWELFTIGDQRFEGRSRCTRCPIVATDQYTGQRSKEPTKTLLKYRVFAGSKSPCFGLNVDHHTQGFVSVEDSVSVETFRSDL